LEESFLVPTPLAQAKKGKRKIFTDLAWVASVLRYPTCVHEELWPGSVFPNVFISIFLFWMTKHRILLLFWHKVFRFRRCLQFNVQTTAIPKSLLRYPNVTLLAFTMHAIFTGFWLATWHVWAYDWELVFLLKRNCRVRCPSTPRGRPAFKKFFFLVYSSIREPSELS
jgi:hypothetical protein